MSPIATGIWSVFARSWATMSGERSMPATRTPRAASGTAILPVPIASSRAPPLANGSRKSTVAAMVAGSKCGPVEES
jgi:hypothetical protein